MWTVGCAGFNGLKDCGSFRNVSNDFRVFPTLMSIAESFVLCILQTWCSSVPAQPLVHFPAVVIPVLVYPWGFPRANQSISALQAEDKLSDVHPSFTFAGTHLPSLSGRMQYLTLQSEMELNDSLLRFPASTASASSTYGNPECHVIVLPKYQGSANGKGLASVCAS